jgi:hypothetical protein
MRLSARLRLLSVRRGTGLTGRGSAPSAGLTEQRGWVQGDHGSAHMLAQGCERFAG